MTYRNLLVQVDESRSCARRIELAVALAAAHDAHLTGVYIISEPSPASFRPPLLPPDLTASLQQEMRERADAALARFGEVAGATRSRSRAGSTGCSTPRSPMRSPPMPATPTS